MINMPALDLLVRVGLSIFYFTMFRNIEMPWKVYPVVMLLLHTWGISKILVGKKEENKDK